MLQDFFSDIAVPDFLKKEFEEKEWYLLPGKLYGILEKQVADTKLKERYPNVTFKGKVHIGKNVKIGERVVIRGPVYIGDNVEIASFAFIRPGSVISNDAKVGNYSIVKSALIMEGAKTSDYVYCGDSILGARARMGAHSSVLNRRFDQGNIDLSYKEEKLSTNLDKFGAIIGEESRLGGNSVTGPGVMIGRNTFIMPGLFITGYIPPRKFVKAEFSHIIRDNKFDGRLSS